MKITFITNDIGITGGSRAIFELANNLQNKRHHVVIVYPLVPLIIAPKFRLSYLIKQLRGTLRNLIKVGKNSWFHTNARVKLIRILTLSPKFIRFFQHLIPDADIVIATAYETAYPVTKLKEKKGEKFWHVQHYEIWDIWNSPECWQQAQKIANNGKDRLSMSMADVVPNAPYLRKAKELVDNTYRLPLKKTVISQWLKELLEYKFGQKVYGLIYHGVNFDSFYIEDGQPRQKRRVLMPYRNTEWKGHYDGIKALEIIRKELPEVEIAMFGHVKNISLPSWVKFYNGLSDDELRILYSSCDVLVFPSWVEGLGAPPMEAMACGTACVAADVGGVRHYTIPGKTALVIPPKAPQKFAHAALQLLRDDSKREEIAKAGYEYIRQFSWEKAASQMEEIFQNTIGHR